MRKYVGDFLALLGCALLIWGAYEINPIAAKFTAGVLAIVAGIMIELADERKAK